MIKNQYFTFTRVNSDYWTANWRYLLDVAYIYLKFKKEVLAYGIVFELKKNSLFLSLSGLFIILVNTPIRNFSVQGLSFPRWGGGWGGHLSCPASQGA